MKELQSTLLVKEYVDNKPRNDSDNYDRNNNNMEEVTLSKHPLIYRLNITNNPR